MSDIAWVERVAQLRKAQDARVTELLEANNREVERRRVAERIVRLAAQAVNREPRVQGGILVLQVYAEPLLQAIEEWSNKEPTK